MQSQNPQSVPGKRRVAGQNYTVVAAPTFDQLPFAAYPQGRKTSARLLRRIRHPQEKCPGNVARLPAEPLCVDFAVAGPRGTTARREQLSFLKIHRVWRDALC